MSQWERSERDTIGGRSYSSCVLVVIAEGYSAGADPGGGGCLGGPPNFIKREKNVVAE